MSVKGTPSLCDSLNLLNLLLSFYHLPVPPSIPFIFAHAPPPFNFSHPYSHSTFPSYSLIRWPTVLTPSLYFISLSSYHSPTSSLTQPLAYFSLSLWSFNHHSAQSYSPILIITLFTFFPSFTHSYLPSQAYDVSSWQICTPRVFQFQEMYTRSW